MDTIKQLTNKFNLITKKSLGQNFILDENITDKITKLSNVKNNLVLEIGPGPGCLTRSLIKGGVKKIIAVEKAKIGDIDITFYKVFIEKEKLTLSIPLNQQTHLRSVSSINQVNKAITILKSKPKIKRTMWSRRAQEYEQKINSGKLYELTEVVRDLNKKTDVIAEQSYSERQLFEKAYDRLKSEFEIILGAKAKEKMDKALKREENITQKELT